MRSVILILALVALTRAWPFGDQPQGDQPVQLPAKTQTCECQFTGVSHEEEEDEVLNARMKEESLLLDQLEKQLSEVEGNFKEVGKKARYFIRKVNSDESHLERLEGSHCAKTEFSCGGHSHQCISKLLVCDGDDDCRNGGDEVSEVCDNPAPAGAVFEADLDGNDPCTIRKPVKIRVTVLTSKSNAHFHTIEHVRAAVVVTFNRDNSVQTDTLVSDGYYTYGRRALVLYPADIPDDNRLMMALIFDNANKNIARGLIFHEATKDVCVRFQLHRKD